MIIIDNFVKDEQLLRAIAEDPTFFQPGYNWWNGWWNPESDIAVKPLHLQLIEYIWRYNTPSEYDGMSASGFEYWTGHFDASVNHGVTERELNGQAVQGNPRFSLNHHFDKDEAWMQQTGELVTPTVGTVFYPVDHKCTGGHLRIYDTHKLDASAPYEVIAPKFNRLIIFDAGQLHAVEEVTSGERKAIAINIWGKQLCDAQMKTMNTII